MENEFVISRELLEEVLRALESVIIEEKQRSSEETETQTYYQDLYDRVRDDTGHMWE